jgi:hypothetical protein
MRSFLISDSFYKSNETTTETSIKADSCKGKTFNKVNKEVWVLISFLLLIQALGSMMDSVMITIIM